MGRTVITNIILFIVLVLAQVLICNHLILFGVAIPFVFIYFILALPMGISQNWLITLSFLIGFTVDIFSDTPGVNSLACTILAVLRNPVFYVYVPRDDKTKVMHPNISGLGWPVYCKYLMTMSFIFCFLTFCIEYFSFAHVKDILLLTLCSGIYTFAVNLAVASLADRKS